MSRLFASLSLGFLLVGCASAPLKAKRFADLQNDATSPSAEVRAWAMGAVDGRKCEPAVRSNALELLSSAASGDPSAMVRSSAVRSLSTFAEPAVAQSLRQAATDRSPFVRTEAVKALGSRLDPETARIVGSVAREDGDVQVRRAAVASLANAGESATREVANIQLAQCLKDEDFLVARAAAAVLRQRTGQDFGTKYDAWASYLRIDSAQQQANPVSPTRMMGN